MYRPHSNCVVTGAAKLRLFNDSALSSLSLSLLPSLSLSICQSVSLSVSRSLCLSILFTDRPKHEENQSHATVLLSQRRLVFMSRWTITDYTATQCINYTVYTATATCSYVNTVNTLAYLHYIYCVCMCRIYYSSICVEGCILNTQASTCTRTHAQKHTHIHTHTRSRFNEHTIILFFVYAAISVCLHVFVLVFLCMHARRSLHTSTHICGYGADKQVM